MASAAASVARSIHDLANAGVECVRIAFRIGIRVDQVSQTLEARDTDDELASWAFVVAGVSQEDVQRELDTYNSSSVSVSILSQVCLLIHLSVQLENQYSLYQCRRQDIR